MGTENIKEMGGRVIFTFLRRKERKNWAEVSQDMTTKYFSNLFLVSEID